jgi:hypothetical protein
MGGSEAYESTGRRKSQEEKCGGFYRSPCSFSRMRRRVPWGGEGRGKSIREEKEETSQ